MHRIIRLICCSGQLNDLEEMLHHKNIKIKGQNVDSANNMVIRELQEELSNARTQLDRWKNEAIQGTLKFPCLAECFVDVSYERLSPGNST